MLPLWVFGTGTDPGPVCGVSIMLSNLLEWFFSWPWVVYYTHVLSNTRLSTQWGLSMEPQTCLSMQHPLASPVLWPVTSSCFCFPRLLLCILNSGRWMDSAWISPPYDAHWKLSPDHLVWEVKWAHLISFPSLQDYCSLFSDVLGLENHCFISTIWCFNRFGHQGKSSPCCSILARNRSARPPSENPSP